ncbi:MAG: hypothetical protein HOH20_03290 [Rhodospirillaceae bacterium]|jgi:hypothetical protein|nr:hypothetical protein [Rhodospirillaceae bacterium]MBT5242272.1 hypothetical protein [Rhodospirillaceae bacterium]MBT5566000.1 hypothetical protein [Rhodospirillaceae bacterium]MBT6088580.1 hypothetical protein [Rhodospirillaceae bacterium]MBT6961398.1 hypothetical protein [Rhodospirillaceae bacterium]
MPTDKSETEHWYYGAAILLLSALYYGLYLNIGFSAADDGNYAQIAYELYLGRAPEELAINYGILWFKIGEGLFHVFGVNYVLVKIFFFAVIAATNILIFYTINVMSGSRLFALTMTAVPLIVPAFPATAFYGFCILLNAAAQMRIAAKITRVTWIDAAIAGAALSLSFQIRPDFGYIWTVPLTLLLLAATFKSSSTHRTWELFGAAIAAFFIVQAPLLVSAMNGGYAGLVLQQYMSYPATMVDYALSGVRALISGNVAQPDSAGSTSLQRPGLTAIGSANTARSSLAILIYLPVIAIGGFVAVNILLIAKRWRAGRFDVVAQSLVALFAAAAAFPHYFFYRPDLSHVANFMPGYVILAAAIILQLYQTRQATAIPWQRWATLTGLSAAFIHLTFFLWVGLQTPGTGSIAVANGRAEPFEAGNGIDVTVSTAEKARLEIVRNAVLQNSEPKDRIVCVPYCPGFAFMSERRMLFKNFYVDDSMLVLDPNWIPDAIELTRDVRPPVVVVLDWAINGTEISRFKNWASDYIAVLEELSQETIEHPGFTIYLL